MFDDGRTHSIVSEAQWARELRSTGYGHVDWTDGVSPEASMQRLIIALASDPGLDLPLEPFLHPVSFQARSHNTRKADTETYIRRAVQGFAIPSCTPQNSDNPRFVLVTGATGSVGGHLVAHLANFPTISAVYCLDRRNKKISSTGKWKLSSQWASFWTPWQSIN
jgi:hypothetical protein